MAGGGKKGRSQEKAICGLLQQPTVNEAAEHAGISEGTLYRWLREDPAFQAAYRQARLETIRQATARLQQACGQAVQTLVGVQTDAYSSASAKVSAAKAVLGGEVLQHLGEVGVPRVDGIAEERLESLGVRSEVAEPLLEPEAELPDVSSREGEALLAVQPAGGQRVEHRLVCQVCLLGESDPATPRIAFSNSACRFRGRTSR